MEHLSHVLHTTRNHPALRKPGHSLPARNSGLSVARYKLFASASNGCRSVCACSNTSQGTSTVHNRLWPHRLYTSQIDNASVLASQTVAINN